MHNPQRTRHALALTRAATNIDTRMREQLGRSRSQFVTDSLMVYPQRFRWDTFPSTLRRSCSCCRSLPQPSTLCNGTVLKVFHCLSSVRPLECCVFSSSHPCLSFATQVTQTFLSYHIPRLVIMVWYGTILSYLVIMVWYGMVSRPHSCIPSSLLSPTT